MKALVIAIPLVLAFAKLPAQTPVAEAQAQKTSPAQRPPDSEQSEGKAAATFKGGFLKTDFGFTSSYPTDWQDQTATLRIRLVRELKNHEGKLGHWPLVCAQPVLRLSHGNPPSLIWVVALTHSCTNFKESNFAVAVELGMCSTTPSHYEIRDTLEGTYKLHDATFWIERSVGFPKDHPEARVTLERVCGWLKSSAVFWEGELRDEDAVKVFEGALTSIDGEEPTPLVPASAIAKLHRP